MVNRFLTQLRQLGLYPKLEDCATWTSHEAVFLSQHDGHLVTWHASSYCDSLTALTFTKLFSFIIPWPYAKNSPLEEITEQLCREGNELSSSSYGLLYHISFCNESGIKKLSCVFSVICTLTSLSFIRVHSDMCLRHLEQEILWLQGQIKASITHYHVLFQHLIVGVPSGFSWNESMEWVYLKTSL